MEDAQTIESLVEDMSNSVAFADAERLVAIVREGVKARNGAIRELLLTTYSDEQWDRLGSKLCNLFILCEMQLVMLREMESSRLVHFTGMTVVRAHAMAGAMLGVRIGSKEHATLMHLAGEFTAGALQDAPGDGESLH